jgi:CRP-like cAMP-binding protein
MLQTDNLARLRSVPLFADLDDDTLERISSVAADRTFRAGSVLIEADQPGSGLYVILDGCTRVELPTRTVDCGTGEIVGELSLLTDRVDRSARVVAEIDTHCLAIARDDFHDLLEHEPRIAVALLPVLARRLIEATDAERG